MNSLQRHIEASKSSEVEVMNLLQNYSMVSDNCVNAQDVAESDCARVIEFLASKHGRRLDQPKKS